MSVLTIGSRCDSCSTVDFLPIQCPSCSLTFCRDHIHSHACTNLHNQVTLESNAISGPSSFAPKSQCQVDGCNRPTIEAIGGVAPGSSSASGGIAKEVRCGACHGAYCTGHRRQAAHSCPGPLDYTSRGDAAIARKAKAQEVLAKHFPNASGRVIPKPPPAGDVQRVRPASPPKCPPSLQPPHPSPQPPPGEGPGPGKTKSKAEKMYELHIRKVRSLAKPLDTRQRPDGERRFFEYCSGVSVPDDIKNWETSGKWERTKVDKFWILSDTPVGKILDVVSSRDKISRLTNMDPSHTLSLLALQCPPDLPRRIISLDNASPASSIPEASLVMLVRGWLDGSSGQ